jgi:enamine deaminase RidA (YjgF/YER057c/UK114 family)
MKRMKRLTLAAAIVAAATLLTYSTYAADKETPNKYAAEPIHEPEFYGSPTSSIASGVSIPEGVSVLWTSGTVPPLLNKDGKTVYERYGDTKTQGIGVLKSIEKQLQEKGLGMEDVFYLRVYVTPDAAKEGKIDFQGWFDAYAEVFNTPENPTKPARSTVGVPQLVNSDWLIEIEAFAAYPSEQEGGIIHAAKYRSSRPHYHSHHRADHVRSLEAS